MVLLLAPYNTAMRLGQGFNSYTQEIMIDDAVVFADNAVENEIQNDGTTMKQLAMAMAKDDVWMMSDSPDPGKVTGGDGGEDHSQDPASTDKAATVTDHPPSAMMMAESAELEHLEQESVGESTDGALLVTHSSRRALAATPAKASKASSAGMNDTKEIVDDDASLLQKGDEKLSEAEKKAKIEERRAERKSQREEAARRAAKAKPWSDADIMKKFGWQLEPFTKDKKGIVSAPKWVYKATGRRGPSQIVTYTSKFVDKLSDIADDMNISGAFSVKYGTIGGSAKGNFIDIKKFKESDLNFYISVKVVNTTTNWKDKLEFQPLSWDKRHSSSEFPKIFGDSFISGFIEGGELNAVVSMKVMDKSNRNAIAAEAKVALTAGPVDVDAQAKVSIAKSNIQKSTETTIQISWSGGGFLKPMQQAWDIESLTEVAARFPDLVAQAPQRTYAILTKYQTLRSFQESRDTPSTPLQYELAKVYTAHLMDTFMDYKSMYTEILTIMEEVQNKTRKFVTPVTDSTPSSTALTKDPTESATEQVKSTDSGATSKAPVTFNYAFIKDTSPFPANMTGFEWARRVCRFQMMAIVNEIGALEDDPKLATIPSRAEVFQSSFMFRSRIPATIPSEIEPDVFLSGDAEGKDVVYSLYDIDPTEPDASAPLAKRISRLDADEKKVIADIQTRYHSAGKHLRVTDMCGDIGYGEFFNGLDFIKNDFVLRSFRCWTTGGAIRAFEAGYQNGLSLKIGPVPADGAGAVPLLPTVDDTSPRMNTLTTSKRVTSISVRVEQPLRTVEPVAGRPASESTNKDATRPNLEITRVAFYTNTGDTYVFQDAKYDAKLFKDTVKLNFECPVAGSRLVGFWGRQNLADRDGKKAMEGLARLGFIWAIPSKPKPAGKKPSGST